MAAVGGGIAVPLVQGDVLEFRMVCSVVGTGAGSQLGVMVRHFVVNSVSAQPAPTLGQFVTQLEAVVGIPIKNLLGQLANYRGCSARRILPRPPTQDAIDTTNAGAGTVLGDLCPKQVCGVISYKTAFAGRAYRGRSYVPFPGEADNASLSLPIGSYITRLDLLAQQLASNQLIVSGPSQALCWAIVYHRKTATFDQIKSAISRPWWGTQRRRSDWGRVNVMPF